VTLSNRKENISMRKVIITIICLSLLSIGGTALAGDKLLSAKLEGTALSFRNNADHNIDMFIRVHAWGCGSPVQKKEKISIERGVDRQGKNFKNSFFKKIVQFDHYVLPPGQWVIVWTWPDAMRCVSNNEEVQFTMHPVALHSSDREGFFKYMEKFK